MVVDARLTELVPATGSTPAAELAPSIPMKKSRKGKKKKACSKTPSVAGSTPAAELARKAARKAARKEAKRSRKEEIETDSPDTEEVPAARPTTGGKCPKSSISVHELKKMNQASVECFFPPVQQPCHWVTDDETVPPSTPLSQATTSPACSPATSPAPKHNRLSRKRKATSPCRSPAAASPTATVAAPVAAPAAALDVRNGWLMQRETGRKDQGRKVGPLMAKAAREATHMASQYNMAGPILPKAKSPK